MGGVGVGVGWGSFTNTRKQLIWNSILFLFLHIYIYISFGVMFDICIKIRLYFNLCIVGFISRAAILIGFWGINIRYLVKSRRISTISSYFTLVRFNFLGYNYFSLNIWYSHALSSAKSVYAYCIVHLWARRFQKQI